jgi:hypothetical protein
MWACVTCANHLCTNYGRGPYLACDIVLSGLQSNCEKFVHNIIILICINIYFFLILDQCNDVFSAEERKEFISFNFAAVKICFSP